MWVLVAFGRYLITCTIPYHIYQTTNPNLWFLWFPHFFFPVCRSWLPFGRHLIICNAFSYQLFQCKRLLPSAISAMPPLLSSAAGFTSVFHLVVTFHSRRHETRPQVGLERTAATASSWQTNETVAVVTAGGTTHIHVHVPHPQPSSVGTSPPAAGFQVS